MEGKPRKPIYKEKPKKFKQQPRRKEIVDNKKEDHEVSTLLLPELNEIFPTFPVMSTTPRTWVVVQSRATSKLYFDKSCWFIMVAIGYGLYTFLLHFLGCGFW